MDDRKLNCESCRGTGWRSVERGGVSYAIKCDHGVARPPQAVSDIVKSDAMMDAVLSPADRMIWGMIARRQGKEAAVRIEEIGRAFWPEEWERKPDDVIRSIKESVSRLRLIAGKRIVASKQKPYGYFIPATAEEADEYAERMFSEGIKLLRICRIFSPQRDWVQELRGQLQLQMTSDK